MRCSALCRVIRFEELFRGTIDAASVYPREVLKETLAYNAAAVIFVHNHTLAVILYPVRRIGALPSD